MYIGLGSNLGRRREYLRCGLSGLVDLPGYKSLAVSGAYETAPVGNLNQGAFINAVAQGSWQGGAEELLDSLLEIESRQGRVRLERWGPRTLDMDLLLFGEQIISSSRLKAPHPGISLRAFVLVPLMELSPQLIVPGLNQSVSRLWDLLEPEAKAEQGVERVAWESTT